MNESDVVQQTSSDPATVASLVEDLSALGVARGMTLLVHSSLTALGWVCGGPVAVILALENVLGPAGTLVMPAHSTGLSDPENWQNPPVPREWWATIRAHMPAYSPDLTPTRQMGAIAETFRKQKGVLRSPHPQVSFAAWGAHATTITEAHPLDFGLGDESPLAKIYDLDGWILLLGTGHDCNTSLHLAEYRSDYSGKEIVQDGAPVFVEGERRWQVLQDIDTDTSDFEAIGENFAAETHFVRSGYVAQAPSVLMPQRRFVDYAVQWMQRNR